MKNKTVPQEKKIAMKWKSWYGNETLSVTLPERWEAKVFQTKPMSVLSDRQIQEAILNPVGTERLSKEVKGKKSVCIVVDDITKPTEAYRTAPFVIDELLRGGIKKEDIFFVIALGTHRALSLPDFKKKVGEEIALNFRIYNHNPYQNNEFIGETKRGTKLFINKMFLSADYKIAIGMLMPHNLAGFSGGGKIVLPGLASIDTVEANHRSALRGLQGKVGHLYGNQIREDIDEAAEKAGLNFIINSVHGAGGETVQLFCGDLKTAYPLAVKAAQEVYACDPEYHNDIGIFNAFPRDLWFLLSLSSLDVWSTRDPERAIVKPGGTIVIINACSEGAGEHGLHAKGMKHYVMRDEHGTFKDMLADRELIFLSPNLSQGTIQDYYRKKASLCRTWDEARGLLQARYPGQAKVACFPCGTLLMDRVVLGS